MMTKTGRIVLCVIAVLLVGGCEETRKIFSRSKTAPDEFAVYTRPPLSMPPDYGLRPPIPGEASPQKILARNQAETAIHGGQKRAGQTATGGPESMSSGTAALLKATRADQADPAIRALVNQEASALVAGNTTLANRLLFWRKHGKNGPSPIVDAEREAKRIRENQALGRPITAGETPTIQRKPKRKGLFN